MKNLVNNKKKFIKWILKINFLLLMYIDISNVGYNYFGMKIKF